jgi:hypothetical protein
MFNEHVLLEGFIFPEEDREKVAASITSPLQIPV